MFSHYKRCHSHCTVPSRKKVQPGHGLFNLPLYVSLDSSSMNLVFIPVIILLDDFKFRRKKKEGLQFSSDLGREMFTHNVKTLHLK